MSSFDIALPSNFSLNGTVRSYGFFLMAPNNYEDGVFTRSLRVAEKKVVKVIIKEQANDGSKKCLNVQHDVDITDKDKAELTKQITRMYRIDATHVDHFYELFANAKPCGYGRLFRSPTLFEDIIKTMTNVNTTFKRTQHMNEQLCKHFGHKGDFPTPTELSKITEEEIAEKCSVGYRAARIINFAKEVKSGKIKLDQIEKLADQYIEIKKKKVDEADCDTILNNLKKQLMSIHGFGEFSTNNVLQLLGIFNIIPSDSETARHLREEHKLQVSAKNSKQVAEQVQKLYVQYEPYQFLVYWFKLYEKHDEFAKVMASSSTAAIIQTAYSANDSTTTTATVQVTRDVVEVKEEAEKSKKKKEKKRKQVEKEENKEEDVDTTPRRRSKRLSTGK